MQTPRQQFRASSSAPAVSQYLAPHGGVTPRITIRLETHTLISCTLFCT